MMLEGDGRGWTRLVKAPRENTYLFGVQQNLKHIARARVDPTIFGIDPKDDVGIQVVVMQHGASHAYYGFVFIHKEVYWFEELCIRDAELLAPEFKKLGFLVQKHRTWDKYGSGMMKTESSVE